MVGSSGRRPRSAPGNPTLVKPVRIGDWPVMNAARPAVQLCCPYQSVKSAPSRATRSILGVRYPIIPLLFALMLNQPISSPQMIRIFGFLFAKTASPFRYPLHGVRERREVPKRVVVWFADFRSGNRL